MTLLDTEGKRDSSIDIFQKIVIHWHPIIELSAFLSSSNTSKRQVPSVQEQITLAMIKQQTDFRVIIHSRVMRLDNVYDTKYVRIELLFLKIGLIEDGGSFFLEDR